MNRYYCSIVSKSGTQRPVSFVVTKASFNMSQTRSLDEFISPAIFLTLIQQLPNDM